MHAADGLRRDDQPTAPHDKALSSSHHNVGRDNQPGQNPALTPDPSARVRGRFDGAAAALAMLHRACRGWAAVACMINRPGAGTAGSDVQAALMPATGSMASLLEEYTG